MSTKAERHLVSQGFTSAKIHLMYLIITTFATANLPKWEAEGIIKTDGNKSVTDKIKIGAKLGLNGFIQGVFSFLWERCKTETDPASGDSSQLAASGDSSKLAASGNYSKLAASG